MNMAEKYQAIAAKVRLGFSSLLRIAIAKASPVRPIEIAERVRKIFATSPQQKGGSRRLYGRADELGDFIGFCRISECCVL